MTKIDDSIKDGFDLIEYPCMYKFKAVCKADEHIDEKLHAIVAGVLSAEAVKDLKQRESKKGSFVSVTIQAELTSREELEDVYSALKASDEVVMTL